MVNLFIRRAAALPLLRLADVEDNWLNALEEADLDHPGVLRFADYVTEQWVDGQRDVWNHFETVGPRTTNHVEGWHSKINKLVTHHPNIFRFISLIKQEQSFCEVTLKQLAAGAPLKPRKRKYRHLEERLVTEKRRLLDGHYTVIQYGDAVSHLVGL